MYNVSHAVSHAVGEIKAPWDTTGLDYSTVLQIVSGTVIVPDALL